jgi:hypothetical protein
MPRLNVQSLITAGLPELVNLCPTDERFYAYINTFQERALAYGRWWGTTQLLEFCVSASTTCSDQGACLIMPREVAVIEAITLNGIPVTPKNAWFNYVQAMPTPTACGGGSCSTGLYRGMRYGPWGVSEDKLTVPSFSTTATGQTIRFYFNSADIGKKIRVQGYDENNVWKRSSIDGTVQDGEQVTLALTGGQLYTDTTTAWKVGSPQAIIKEATSYNVSMFAVDEDGTVAQKLADYQPDELTPTYRKFYIPGNIHGCGDDGYATLRAVVSLQHVPVSKASDWLLFDDAISAYEDGVQAVWHWRNGNRQMGNTLFDGSGAEEPSRNGRGVLRHVKGPSAITTLQAVQRKMTADTTTVQVHRAGVSIPYFV